MGSSILDSCQGTTLYFKFTKMNSTNKATEYKNMHMKLFVLH